MGMLDISNKVLAELENGQSREAIFQKFTSSAPQDVAKIAFCIGSIPRKELRRKYLRLNALLCILLVAYSILTVLSAMPIDLNQPTLFLLIRTLIPLLFTYFVFRFHGGVYRLLGAWCLIDLLETILLTGVPNGTVALKFSVIFFVMVVSFGIARKVFSHLRLIGPRKNSNGDYLLG